MAKVNLTFNIPDGQVQAIVKDFTDHFGYLEKDEDGIVNPVTRAQFAKQCVIDFIRRSVKTQREVQGVWEAQQLIRQQVDDVEIA